MLEAKCERHDEILHEFDQSSQQFVLCRDEVYHLELGVVVGKLGHEVGVPARRVRHGTPKKVGADELKPLRDLTLAWLVAKWLFDAVINLVNASRDQRIRKIECNFGDVPRGLYGALVWMSRALVPDVPARMSQALGPDARPSPPPWQLWASPV